MNIVKTIIAFSVSMVFLIGFSTEACGQFTYQSKKYGSDRFQSGRTGGQEIARSRSRLHAAGGTRTRHIARPPVHKEKAVAQNQVLIDPFLALRLQRQLELNALNAQGARAQRRSTATFGSSTFGPSRGQGTQSFGSRGASQLYAGSTAQFSGQSQKPISAASSKPLIVKSPFANFIDEDESQLEGRLVDTEQSSKPAKPVSSKK